MRRFYYALVATYALFHLLQWWADHGAWVRRCLPAMMHVRQCTHHQVQASAGLHARCLSVRCNLFAWWLARTVSTRSLAILHPGHSGLDIPSDSLHLSYILATAGHHGLQLGHGLRLAAADQALLG